MREFVFAAQSVGEYAIAGIQLIAKSFDANKQWQIFAGFMLNAKL